MKKQIPVIYQMPCLSTESGSIVVFLSSDEDSVYDVDKEMWTNYDEIMEEVTSMGAEFREWLPKYGLGEVVSKVIPWFLFDRANDIFDFKHLRNCEKKSIKGGILWKLSSEDYLISTTSKDVITHHRLANYFIELED